MGRGDGGSDRRDPSAKRGGDAGSNTAMGTAQSRDPRDGTASEDLPPASIAEEGRDEREDASFLFDPSDRGSWRSTVRRAGTLRRYGPPSRDPLETNERNVDRAARLTLFSTSRFSQWIPEEDPKCFRAWCRTRRMGSSASAWMQMDSTKTCWNRCAIMRIPWIRKRCSRKIDSSNASWLTRRTRTWVEKCERDLRILRCFLQDAIEFTSCTGGLRKLLENPYGPDAAQDSVPPTFITLDEFLKTCVEFLCTTRVDSNTYVVLNELTTLLIVCASTELYSSTITSDKNVHPFLDHLFSMKEMHPILMQTLLRNYLDQDEPPVGTVGGIKTSDSGARRNVQSKPSMEGLSKDEFNYCTPIKAGLNDYKPLAMHSLLFMLLISYHLAGNKEPNPFRQILQTCTNFRSGNQVALNSQNVLLVPFSRLYDEFTAAVKYEAGLLLLYTLLHGNREFREYVISRSDLDNVVVPLLQELYQLSSSPNCMYMLLITILMLTHDSSFCASIQKIQVKRLSWYKEQHLGSCSLGNLVVLIMAHSIKKNLADGRDIYMHTNCLATLANLAPHMDSISTLAAQQLLILFYLFSRKYFQVQARQARQTESSNVSGPKDFALELQIYTDFLRIVLEVINAILTYALPKNLNMVYALLHKEEYLQPFRDHIRFQELLDNVDTVLEFFNSRIDYTKSSMSFDTMMEQLRKVAVGWKGEGLKIFTELRFTYEEEPQSEDFFVPYAWSIVLQESQIPWNTVGVVLLRKGEREWKHQVD